MRTASQKSAISSWSGSAGLHRRRHDLARPVGEAELAERLRIVEHHAGVEDAHRLVARVVVDDHLARADDRRTAQLARRQPGELDVGNRTLLVLEVDERDVGNRGEDAAAAHRRQVGGGFLEPVAENREVVRPEIPRNADVGLVEPEVHAARRDEVDVAELARVDEITDRVDGRAVEERVARHQGQAALARDARELVSPPRRDAARGFSMNTCLPARRAASPSG